MAYIGADGNVGGPKSFVKGVIDFFNSIINFFWLFGATLIDPKAMNQIETSATTRTFAQRNGGRSYRADSSSSGGGGTGRRLGSNVRGINNLGDPCAKVGGG